MTAPRMVLPGRTYLITRRTAQRQYLLRPDDETNKAFEFCLALAAWKYGIDLIAWCAMSNHYHAVVHDEDGRVSDFIQYFHRLLAAVLNVKWGRRENLWSSDAPCVTFLAEEEDIIAMVAYVLANPVAAHLVERADQWVGATAVGQLHGRARTIDRPGYYFAEDSKVVPETMELAAAMPPGFSMSRSDFNRAIRKAVADIEAEAAAKRRSNKTLRVVGAAAVRSQRHTGSPNTKAGKSKLRPCVACSDKKKRIEQLVLLKQFRLHHRQARKERAEGKRKVIFPIGTLRPKGHAEILVGERDPIDRDRLMKHITRLS